MSDSISIPGYRIVRKLGQGGMASVHLAIQESFDREVALKVMSPFLNSDPSFATRFLREARIVAQIHHSSIVPVVDVGQHGGHHYLSMEYLPGGDLKQRIVEGRHGPNLALNICVSISSALDLAHRKGFVHRDIKPENILFREDGTPVLTDFGIARAIDAGTQLTMVGTMVGTPSYMSPEQVKGGELDGRSDLYSLGVVFYEMLTGLVPFSADSTMTLAMKHLTEPLPLLPPQFGIYQPFLDRLMAKDRDDRFGSGAEVIRALRLITDMAITRETTILRNRTSQPSGTEMPTLVSPITGSMGVPLAAAEAGTVRFPSTSTQPSGVMQIPALGTPPSGVHPLPEAMPTVQLASAEHPAIAAPTLVSPPRASMDLEDMTVPRPSSEKPVAAASPEPRAPKAQAKPTVPRPPGVPLQVRARALVQKISSSKHSTWAAAGVIGLLAIASGYLLGRTTDAESPVPVARPAPPVPGPAIEQTRVALVIPPQPEIAPIEEETIRAAGDQISAPETGGEVPPALPPTEPAIKGILSGGSSAELDERAAREAKKQKSKIEADLKRAERDAAQKLLAQQQRDKTAQAQREREARIKELLRLAKVDISKGRLVSPMNENAVDRYREVIAKEPSAADDQEARNGLKRVADILVQEIDRALANGSRQIAGQLIDSLRSVQFDHPELARLQSRMEDTTSGGGAKPLSARNRTALERAMDRVETALKRDPQTLGSVKDALKEYDRAQSISNVASGMSILRGQIEEAFSAAAQYEISKTNLKQAREVIAIARSRSWLTPELLQIEKTMDATQSP
jgi:serine/threonine protein kinase